ncbi:MAG: MFS transporter [Opitutae bacterium]|nr:MFS transporter [Opitutae bacterium]
MPPSPTRPPAGADPGPRIRRRVLLRLLPLLFVLYVVAHLDRTNVSFGALEMSGDLGFSPRVYGLGAGIFFLGYVLLEIPGALIAYRWSVRKWVARIMISWGVLAAGMGFIHTSGQFYWMRFLLGLAEAGFFPAMIIYIGRWFVRADRAKALALFMSAISAAIVLGGPVSGLLMKIDWLGLPGWRWMFILEGVPAVGLGFVALFFLTDHPREARWLAPADRAWLESELRSEAAAAPAAAHGFGAMLREARRPRVLLLAAAYFFAVACNAGFSFWLPSVIQSVSSLPTFAITLLASLPAGFGFGAKLLAGWSSDRTRERYWHTVALLGLGASGLALAALYHATPGLALFFICVAALGFWGNTPCFWALGTEFLAGTSGAFAIGLVNTVGQLGGFVGPYALGWLRERGENFAGGFVFLAACLAVATGLVAATRLSAKPISPYEDRTG